MLSNRQTVQETAPASARMEQRYLFSETQSVPEQKLVQAIVEDLAVIPEVRRIWMAPLTAGFRIWIALVGDDASVRERMYQKELALFDTMPEFDFDFNLIPAEHCPAGEDFKLVLDRL